jgi:signal transduction histidine kinase
MQNIPASTNHIAQLEEANSLLRQAFEKRGSDLVLSVHLTKDALKKYQALQFEEGIAKANNQLGLFYLIRSDFEKAESFSQQALYYFELVNDIKGIADARYNMGGIYYRTNKYHQGLIELSKCLVAYRQLNDHHNQARALKSMGTIYEFFNDEKKAIESYEKSIEASQQVNDLALESNALNPLSGIYLNQGLEKLASDTIDRSIELKTKINDTRGLAFALYGRGKISVKKKNYAAAITDFRESERILLEVEDMLGVGIVYNKMGIAYQEMGNLGQANFYFLKALELGEKYKVQFLSFKANFNLYVLSKSIGDSERALAFLEKYFLQKEQVINSENYNIIKSYEALSKIEALERESLTQKEKNEIVEKKNAELDSFFYRVSHDLKGPISSLLGLNSIVKLDIIDPIALHLFDMYHSQSVRMNDIVMGLINLTEIKNTEKVKSKINFEKLIDECVNSCRYLPHFDSVKINKKIENFHFYSEWIIINTILQNLIENAIKYSDPDKDAYIKITITKELTSAAIRVEDNGHGIAENHQENVFNMFYRASDKASGTGLGLYILKRALERLNGTVEFTSVLNEGSNFLVRLPLS